MKEDIDVLERHWLIASTKETGRKTKINKNKYFARSSFTPGTHILLLVIVLYSLAL